MRKAAEIASAFDDKDVHTRVDQLGSQVGDTVDPITERPLLDDEVPSVDPTKLPQPLGQQGPLVGRGRRRRPGPDETNPVDLPRLLCVGGERRKREAQRENNEPDKPHEHLVEDGWRESTGTPRRAPAKRRMRRAR